MFTRNFNAAITSALTGKKHTTQQNMKAYTGESFATSESGDLGSKWLAEYAAKAVKYSVSKYNSTSNNAAVGIRFGSGNMAPTIDDVNLEGTVATKYTESHTQEITYEDDGTQVITTVYTITSTDEENDIVIGEIGMFTKLYGTTNTITSNSYIPVLLERSVLDAPITIEPLGVGQITYIIRIPPAIV